jgi:uncharacterized protein (TIGR03000 family)
MYSMVLMAALTTGTDVPDWGRRWGCHGCWGCYGCWGGCWGCWGCHGCWGGCWGCWGCYGCWGGWGGWSYAYAPGAVSYAAPMALAYDSLPASPPVTTTRSMYPDTSAANRATIIVHLPEAATLTVDGKPTTSTSTTRRFYSPPLEPGKSYHYTFVARMEHNGKEVKAQRRVQVSAGDQKEITFTLPDFNPPLERPQTAKPEERKDMRVRRLPIDRRG